MKVYSFVIIGHLMLACNFNMTDEMRYLQITLYAEVSGKRPVG